MKKRLTEKDELELMGAVDTQPRLILSDESVQFNCKYCTSGTGWVVFGEAKRNLKKRGHSYQCSGCRKTNAPVRGIEWRKNLSKSRIASEACRNASVKVGKSRIKYTAEQISTTLERSGVTRWEGDLSTPSNVIDVWWSDGAHRRVRIRRFMVVGVLSRPKMGGGALSRKRHFDEVARLKLEVEIIAKNRAALTYRGFSWTQRWVNHVDKQARRMMANIDLGHKLQALVDEGLSLYKACKAVGVDHNRYYRNRKLGIGVIATSAATMNFARLIDIPGAIYNCRLSPLRYRPDVLLEQHKLVIEIDGMHSHSEAFKSRTYHFDRWVALMSAGYRVLGFSEFEVREKRDIVDSMIAHRTGKSARIGARQCQLVEVNKKTADAWFKKNHLKGSGIGTTYALTFNGSIVAALRWHNNPDHINISRFACALNTSVSGAYSRLISRLPTNKDIVNFVDRRHGDGRHLAAMGFVLVKTHIGFEWTDNYFHWNRRRFLGSTGYDKGLKKFYDYGQMKYVRPAALKLTQKATQAP